MVFNMLSAATGFALLLLLWLTPLVLFVLRNDLRGLEKASWAMLIAILTWPGLALYLFYSGTRKRHSGH